jgi:hypothetical protein
MPGRDKRERMTGKRGARYAERYAQLPREVLSGVNYLDRSATIILAGVMGFGSVTSSG